MPLGALLQGISPPADEHDECRPRSAAVGSGSSPPPGSRGAAANANLLSCGKGLAMGLPETQLLPPQEQGPADPNPGVSSDAPDPLSLESEGNAARRDITTSAAAVCASPGVTAGPTAPGTHGAEPRRHGRAGRETPTQSSPDREASAEGRPPSLLPGKTSPGPRISGSVPLRSPGKTQLDTAASAPGSARSHQGEGRREAGFPSGGRRGGGEARAPCPPARGDGGRCPASGFHAPRGRVGPSHPEQPPAIPETPSRATERRSLEGMGKQTGVELSDTSSEDEDRLVIEL